MKITLFTVVYIYIQKYSYTYTSPKYILLIQPLQVANRFHMFQQLRFEFVRTLYSFCVQSRRSRHSKNVPHNFRLITSRQLSMSSVTNPGTCWYFCATPKCTSDNRKNGKYRDMQNVQFHVNLHTSTREQAPQTPHSHPPHSSFLEVFNCGTCQQIQAMSSSILMVFAFLF